MSDHAEGLDGTGAAFGAVRGAVGRGSPAPDGRAGGVPGGAVVRSVWAALWAAGRPMTAREVADALGTRRESANRALGQLERAGWARRERGDAKAGTPDLWCPVAGSREEDLTEHAPQAGTMRPTLPVPDATYSRFPARARQARMRAASSMPPAAPGTYRERAPQRLAAGELQEQVLELLMSRPGEPLGPLHVARALGGRSQGAVVNACKRLVAKGEAVCTCQAPLRFAAASRLE